jgi:hypothetical protein
MPASEFNIQRLTKNWLELQNAYLNRGCVFLITKLKFYTMFQKEEKSQPIIVKMW